MEDENLQVRWKRTYLNLRERSCHECKQLIDYRVLDPIEGNLYCEDCLFGPE